MLTALFVMARIIANPFSNVFQKQLTQRDANPIFIIGATHALLTAVCLPIVLGSLPLALGDGFWTNMAICALLTHPELLRINQGSIENDEIAHSAGHSVWRARSGDHTAAKNWSHVIDVARSAHAPSGNTTSRVM